MFYLFLFLTAKGIENDNTEKGGKTLSSEDCFDMRSKVIALLRNELPVLRAKARVSQEDIANKIGISRQTYSSIETGKREMSWTTFLALIAFFQNTESTKQMLNSIEGLSKGLENIVDPDNEK